jgi:hypothetical protein
MRRSLLFLLVTTLVLSGIPSKCRSFPKTPSVQALPSLGSDCLDLPTLRALLGMPFQMTTEHFTLLYEAGAGDIPKTSHILECAYGQFYESLTRAGFQLSPPAGRLVWICFPNQSGFNNYAVQTEGMDLSWLGGYYSTRTNRVAIVQAEESARGRPQANALSEEGTRTAIAAQGQRRGMSAAGQGFDVAKLTHELAHQLAFNSGLQKRGVMYPFWASEGLATSFEFDSSLEGELIPSPAGRRNGVVGAWRAGELVPLRQFIVQTQAAPDLESSRRDYAQAWAFFQFMLTEHPEGLRRYLRQIAGQPAGPRDAGTLRAEFATAFGPPQELERSWNAFLDRQAQNASAERAGAPVLPQP